MSDGFVHEAPADDDLADLMMLDDGGTVDVDVDVDAEPSITLVDGDGDGLAEVIAVDDTGDGRADFAFVDETGDGLVDVVVVPGETLTIDNSGVLADGDDAVANALADASDVSDVFDASDDAPAEAEPSVTLVDGDGDGAADVVAVDDTGDGRADFVLVDETGDGLVDVVVVPGETLTIDNSGVLTEPAVDDGADPGTFDVGDIPVDADLPGLPGDVLEPEVDPEVDAEGPADVAPDPNDDSIAGDPVGDADEWFLQAANGFCVPAALAMVITEFTGEPVTDLGVAAVAEELGHFSAEGGGEDGFSGMTSQGALETLIAMGVPAHLEYAPDDDPFSALAAHLESGRDVIIALDSDELWYDADDDAADGALDANHVVVVTGVDTDAGVIYVNDPGNPDGEAMEVPLSELEEAWEDSDYEMLVTDAPAPDTDLDVDVDVAGDADAEELEVGSDLGLPGEQGIFSIHSTGLVYLPVVLARAVLS